MAKCCSCGKRGLFLKLHYSMCEDCLLLLHTQKKKEQPKQETYQKPFFVDNITLAEEIMKSLTLSFDQTPKQKLISSKIDEIKRSCNSQKEIAAKAFELAGNPVTSRGYAIKSWAASWAGASFRKETIKWSLKWIETNCESNHANQSYAIGCTPQQTRLSEGYERLAQAYEGEYMFAEALSAYKKAKEIRPSGEHYTYAISRIYTKMNRLDDAISFLKNEPLTPTETHHMRSAHLDELIEKKNRGYVYRPRKKKEN